MPMCGPQKKKKPWAPFQAGGSFSRLENPDEWFWIIYMLEAGKYWFD